MNAGELSFLRKMRTAGNFVIRTKNVDVHPVGTYKPDFYSPITGEYYEVLSKPSAVRAHTGQILAWIVANPQIKLRIVSPDGSDVKFKTFSVNPIHLQRIKRVFGAKKVNDGLREIATRYGRVLSEVRE